MSKNYFNIFKTGLTILLISLPAVFSLLRPGFFSMYDDMQVIRLQQMDKCIKDFQIPCRWVPDLGYGYGYPLYIYYAPLPYYAMELINLIGFSFIDSVKTGFALSIILSALFFYLFLKKFLKNSAALFGTFLYIYAPMRAADLYVRGAMGELWGMFSLAFIFWGFEYFFSKRTRLSVSIFALTIVTWLISHNLTVLMSTPFLALWIIARIYFSKKKKNIWKKTLIAGMLGAGLSAFYWVPLILEKNLVHLETLTEGYFGYLAHFLSLKQIFISTNWGYGPSILGPLDDAFLGIGPIHSLVGIAGLFITLLLVKTKKLKVMAVIVFGIFLTVAFLSHEKSTFLWKSFEFLKYLQFPWRFVMLAMFATSVLGGLLINSTGKKTGFLLFTILILSIIVLYGGFFKPKDWFNISDAEKLSGQNLERQLTASIYDYLPKSATKAPDEIAPDGVILLDGDVEVKDFEKGSNWFSFTLNSQNGAQVALPAYDFPGWKVYINDSLTKKSPHGELGLVSFNISEGHHNVFTKLYRSNPRIAGDIISIIAISTLVFYLSYGFGFLKTHKTK